MHWGIEKAQYNLAGSKGRWGRKCAQWILKTLTVLFIVVWEEGEGEGEAGEQFFTYDGECVECVWVCWREEREEWGRE